MTIYRLEIDIRVSPEPQDAREFFAALAGDDGPKNLAKFIAQPGFNGTITFSDAMLRALPPRADDARAP